MIEIEVTAVDSSVDDSNSDNDDDSQSDSDTSELTESNSLPFVSFTEFIVVLIVAYSIFQRRR